MYAVWSILKILNELKEDIVTIFKDLWRSLKMFVCELSACLVFPKTNTRSSSLPSCHELFMLC